MWLPPLPLLPLGRCLCCSAACGVAVRGTAARGPSAPKACAAPRRAGAHRRPDCGGDGCGRRLAVADGGQEQAQPQLVVPEPYAHHAQHDLRIHQLPGPHALPGAHSPPLPRSAAQRAAVVSAALPLPLPLQPPAAGAPRCLAPSATAPAPPAAAVAFQGTAAGGHGCARLCGAVCGVHQHGDVAVCERLVCRHALRPHALAPRLCLAQLHPQQRHKPGERSTAQHSAAQRSSAHVQQAYLYFSGEQWLLAGTLGAAAGWSLFCRPTHTARARPGARRSI